MFVFASDTGQPLRHVTTNNSQNNRKSLAPADYEHDSSMGLHRGRPLAHCVAWDPDILSFTACMSYQDRSIWQWKIPFDAIGRDDSDTEFAVVALRNGEATLIHPPDVVKADVDEGMAAGEATGA